MLIDKGYYDYDYQKPSEETQAALTAAKSDDEMKDYLSKIGLRPRERKRLTPEEAQRIVMEEIKENGND